MSKKIMIKPLKLGASIFCCLCLLTITSCESKDDARVTDIGEARSLPLGTKVTILGRITVASGGFASSTPYGYALQNGKEGIYVMDSTANAKDKYFMGEWVKVTGKLERVYGILMVQEENSKKQMPRIRQMPPVLANTADISEATAGKVVQTKGVVDSVVNDLPYGYKIYMNDGSGQLLTFVNTSTDLLGDSTLWKSADSLQVTGFSTRYESTFELCPRIFGDIRILK